MIIVPTTRGFRVSAPAALLGESERLQAWAERHVRTDPDLKWLLGNYVEADTANLNGHIFPLEDLYAAQHTVASKPLNMMHREHYIVGAVQGAQLLDAFGNELVGPDQVAASALAAGKTDPPLIEVLAAMWHGRFPEEYFNIRQAHSEGSLYFSMEAVPKEVSCPTCDHRSVFAGFESPGYCSHMQGIVAPKRLHSPTFQGAAVIIPPITPGWERADITAIAECMKDKDDVAEMVYGQVANEAAHLDPDDWESLMQAVMLQARSPEEKRS